ncbi:hypothetical protein ZIOFF_021950 [Zingiber officinale]|uniref:ABC transmembrane type-1 domain-containing protein n=1 Tax=Zingiber officinale TaxID=94328 RepID=A0A8J5H8W6_ZINOF|nr:hypothetical protein ZIOFF_021950 [Zingiber officinale]
MTMSSTASALILAIILLLVAPLSPGNCASTGEGNALFFSFDGSGKNRSFATEFALYGDAEMNSSDVRVTRAANESSGLMIYWKPVRFFGTKPGFFPSDLGTTRELSRLNGVCKAPIIQHFSESLSRSTTIRSFDQHQRFINTNFNLSDQFSRLKFHTTAAMQWLCLRLDMLSSVVFAFSLLFLISMPRGVIDPGISGLAVTYGLNLNKIDAHIGSVNDIAFSYPKKTLSIITCGDDKAIKSTASVAPQLCQPPNGILMTNERSDNNPEEATACIALSKNDSYATSASGGKVSLLNMRTFKVITTFMPTPPAATSLAFHPEDNNMIAAGTEDSSILIYNIRIDEVNGCIQELQLNSSGIGDEGARVIADMLKENQTLRVLELNNNMIEYSGFASLAGALVENKTRSEITAEVNGDGTMLNKESKGHEEESGTTNGPSSLAQTIYAGSEEALLVTSNQSDRSFIQHESFNQLQRSGMRFLHMGVIQVRIQILHRQEEGTVALVVFRDNRWQGDQAIFATIEVDLTYGSQIVYVIPDTMLTISDFYRNIQISVLTRGYENWRNGEANLLVTRGMVARLSNTPNVGFAYSVANVASTTSSPPTYKEQDEEVQSDEEEVHSQHLISVLTHEEPLLVKKIDPSAQLHQRKTLGAAGYDLAINRAQDIPRNSRSLLTTGISIQVPQGTYARVAPRSSASLPKEILIGGGVIDSDYRGEVKILAFNTTNTNIYLQRHECIAQLIVEHISTPEVVEVNKLDSTIRNHTEFGSTTEILCELDTVDKRMKELLANYDDTKAKAIAQSFFSFRSKLCGILPN